MDQLKGFEQTGFYGIISDSKNNLWMAEFDEGHLGEIDAKTKQVRWYTPPTPHGKFRRLNVDDQDRVISAEYGNSKVSIFDPRTEKFAEYDLPVGTHPYRADIDKNGEIWASTMHTDRVVRLNPKTRDTTQYLMPSDTNMRTIFVDNTTTPVTIWVGSNHDHRLVKVEPQD
jgi:streptogramin lyase